MARMKTNKRLEIARLLEQAILTGRLAPGARLPEIRLGREMGVSQAIIREALQDLEARGLILKRTNQGSTVIRLEPEDLVHIYQIRRELEPLAFALAAGQRRPSTFDALAGCLDEMRSAAGRHDFPAFSEADVRFHRQVWASQPNRYLERTLEAVCLPLFAYDRIGRAATAGLDYERVTRQHELVLTALRSGDEGLVQRLVERLMRKWLRMHLADYDRIQENTALSDSTLEGAIAYLKEQAKGKL